MKLSNKSKSMIAIKMLDHFKEDINRFYKQYTKKKISSEELINMLQYFSVAWKISRVDIKNIGTKQNVINFLDYEKDISITFPEWYEDKTGKGSQIEYVHSSTNIIFNCINDGKLEIMLRSIDYRDFDGREYPIYINYTGCKINGEDILNEEKLVWSFEPYIYTKKCYNDKLIKLKIECETIYDFYPYLEYLLLDIDNENDLEYKIKNINNYIDQQKIQTITKELNKVSSINEDLMKKFESYKMETDTILNSYNKLFNNLIIYHTLEPKKLLKLSRQLNIELLNFIDNICRKYNLKWWLYAGTLLGAIRHEGYIPWDDDININMLREDYEKLYRIINNEIDKHNLNKFMKVNTNTVTNNNTYSPFMKLNYYVENNLYGFINIFPTDYIEKLIPNIETVFWEERQRVLNELKKGSDRSKTLNTSFKKLHVSNKKTNTLMSGVECSIFSTNDYNTIFPLTTLKFENHTFPCPNKYKKYVSSIYGNDFMKIPKIVSDNGFYDYLSDNKDAYRIFNEEILKLRDINRNFDSKFRTDSKKVIKQKNRINRKV